MKTAVLLLALFAAAVSAQESSGESTVVPPYKCEGNSFVCKFKEMGHAIKHHAIHLGGNLADVGSAILSSAIDTGKNLLANSAQAVLGSVLEHLNKNVLGKRELVLFNKLKEHVKNGVEMLKQARDRVRDAFKTAVGKVTNFISNISGLKLDKESENIDSAVAEFKRESEIGLFNFATAISKTIQDMFVEGVERVKNFFGIRNQEKRFVLSAISSAWQATKNAFSGVSGVLADVFRPHIDALNNGLNNLAEKAATSASGLYDTVSKSFGDLKDKLSTHVDALKGHASKLGDHAINAVNALKEAVSDIASQAISNVKNTAKDAVQTGKDAVKTVGDHVAGTISSGY